MVENFEAGKTVDESQKQQTASNLRDDANLAQPPKLNPTSLLAATPLQLVQDNKPQASAMDGVLQDSRLARLGVVTGEGLLYSVPGAGKAFLHDVTHKVDFAQKVATAGTLGVVLRTALPKAGAARAAAAAIFTIYMVKDAAKPMMQGWSDAWDPQTHSQLNESAQKMGDGLGMFAWDSGVGIFAAGMGEKMTDRAMRSVMGEPRYTKFENAKTNFFSSDNTIVGRGLNKFTRAADALTESIARRMGDATKERPDLPFADKLKAIDKVEQQYAVEVDLKSIHRKGLKTTDNTPVGFTETVDLLMMGKDPRTINSTVAQESLGRPLQGADSPLELVVGNQSGKLPLDPRLQEAALRPKMSLDTRLNNLGLNKSVPKVEGDVLPATKSADPNIVEIPGFKVDLKSGHIIEADVLSRDLAKAKFNWHQGDKGVTIEYLDHQGRTVSKVENGTYDATKAPKDQPAEPWKVEYFNPETGASIGQTTWTGRMALQPVEGKFQWESANSKNPLAGPNSEYGKFAQAKVEATTGSQTAGILQTPEAMALKGTDNGTGGGAKPTDATGAKAGTAALTQAEIAAKVAGELNATNIDLMAQMNKQDMARWTDEKQQVVDAIEGAVGPVHTALKPAHRPLDPGYMPFRDQMVGLGNQVKEVAELQQVWPLFSRARDAAVQNNSTTLGPTGRLTHELNLLGLEIHTGLKHGLQKAGVSENVLDSKNPPLFQVAFDRGAGPHTLPEIEGVWDVDLVHYPRNMTGTRSTTTSGIYGHEVGHDQYGGILKFAESITGGATRDGVITKAVEKGLGSHASDMVDVPGHGKMKKSDLVTEILKAQANENTADIWGAAWTGPNSGASLGLLLQSLRQGGLLETRNVYGKEFAAKGENAMGFEVHAIDAFRPKLIAEVIRYKANGDPLLLEYAKALDKYSVEAARKSPDYEWANMDQPGQKITIPRAELDAVIPELVKMQMETPLPALEGKTFGQILPDLPSNMRKMDQLADAIVDAVLAGKSPDTIPFSINDYTINQVFGAGLPASLRLVGKGMSAPEANAKVNEFGDFLRAKYHHSDPHVDPLKSTPSLGQMILNPSKAMKILSRGLGSTIGGQPRARFWSGEHAHWFAGSAGMALGKDLWTDYGAEQSDLSSQYVDGNKGPRRADTTALPGFGGPRAPQERPAEQRNEQQPQNDVVRELEGTPQGTPQRQGDQRQDGKPAPTFGEPGAPTQDLSPSDQRRRAAEGSPQGQAPVEQKRPFSFDPNARRPGSFDARELRQLQQRGADWLNQPSDTTGGRGPTKK